MKLSHRVYHKNIHPSTNILVVFILIFTIRLFLNNFSTIFINYNAQAYYRFCNYSRFLLPRPVQKYTDHYKTTLAPNPRENHRHRRSYLSAAGSPDLGTQ